MRKTLPLLLVAVLAAGCASGIRAAPVSVRLNGDPSVRCIDRALTFSRNTGYIEQTVDKDTGFFRVVARSGNRGGKPDVTIRNFNVACQPDGNTVVITPVSDRGVIPPNAKLTKKQGKELRDFGGALGTVTSGEEPAE